ncbi:sulfotransferase 2B1-like isoform X1 [Rana temporaria]|uniref:sulfotransferase 2B1-like isoform X1 n=2 Tax=Rana temporaria TaxID=8407 RepID=UPI001AAC94AD|nr:sulfotransferase 2B1-like isoform X1 [Rana temporaria]
MRWLSIQMSGKYFTYKGVNFSPGSYSQEGLNFAENEFQVQDDDVYIVTYPKSGTNWMIEILSLIKTNGDPTWCNSVPIWLRSPWFETLEGQSQIKDVTPPRVLTSHLPLHIFAKSFFTSKAKIIYVMRNPKDILVSLFHFSKINYLYKDPESFQEFFEDFLQGNVLYSSWFDHVKGWMQMKTNKNFFYITYEELHQDLRGSVVKIFDFLGKELHETQTDLVVKNTSFKVMKENKMSNYSLLPQDFIDQTKGSFMRKGITGDWKSHFTVAQNECFDKVYQEKMKDLNMKFFWEDI